MLKRARQHAGQSIIEFSLILAIVAIVALPSIVLLCDAQVNFFNAHSSLLNADSMYTEPASAADCAGEGYEDFYTDEGTFDSAIECSQWFTLNAADD